MNAPVTVRDYLRLLFRRKYAIVAPILCSVFLILPMWKIVPEKYRATALVKRKDLALTNAAAGSLMLRDNGPVPVETMRAEILTWTNLDRVIKQLKLDVDLKTSADWQDEYEKLKTSITIKTAAQGRGVDLIEIAVMDRDAGNSQKIANAIADNYVEESQRNSRDDTLQAIDYFKAQCDDNLAIVRKMNIELDKYTREHWTELPEVKRGILSSLQTLRTTEGEHLLLLSAGQNRLTEIDRQIKEVEKTIKSDVQTMDNPAREDLNNQLMARQKRLTEMMVSYTEDHPHGQGPPRRDRHARGPTEGHPRARARQHSRDDQPAVPETPPGPHDRRTGGQGRRGLASRDPGADHGERGLDPQGGGRGEAVRRHSAAAR